MGGRCIARQIRKRELRREIFKRAFQIFKRAMMVKMFRVNIGNNRHGRFQAGNDPSLSSASRHPVTTAQLGIAAPARNNPAIYHCRVDIGRIQQGCHQRGCGGLAMVPATATVNASARPTFRRGEPLVNSVPALLPVQDYPLNRGGNDYN